MKKTKELIFIFGILTLYLILLGTSKKIWAANFMYLKTELFSWHQTEDFAGRPVNQGILYGIGTQASWRLWKKLNLRITSEITGNRFDVEKDLGIFRIYEQNVEFLMIKVTADLGWWIELSDSVHLQPYGTFGYHRWLRDVERYHGLPAYTQIWRSHFARAGMRIRWNISSDFQSFFEGGLIIPLSNRMKMNEPRVMGRVNFDNKLSGYGEINLLYKKLLIGFYYEGFRFPASRNRIDWFIQPRTSIDSYGLKFGTAF